ncbi:MAG: uroporphyrinogen-III C-methyltransferase [Clostridium sp.]|nr:uroporphyrinogen-III C-methyltransferase [Clostridium sp.]
MQGKVWLVGAGPSDEGLFTLKGKHVLEKADVVIYDQLVGDGIMKMIPSDVTCIDVGKHAGNHKVVQEKINEILLDEALKGKRVVRLKGGDPFLFGRGGEELELLCEHNVPFEIVPGITSAISVPAYAGIPVTHRDFTSSLHIITGHKKKGCNDPIDYKSLVALGDVTLVFLMSVGALPEISKGLIEAGMDKNMPAAILEKGTRYNQRKVVATIETLPEEARKNNIGTPGIIIVGKVCSLSEQFSWAEKRPLGGSRIIITRPRRKSSKLKEMLYDLGAEIVELPSIKTVAINNNDILDEAINNIKKYNWITFTSEASVEIFFDSLLEKRVDIRNLVDIKFAVVGPATKKAVEKRGLFTDYIPEEYYGESMAKGLAKHISIDDKIMVCVAREVDSELCNNLKEYESQMDIVPLYDIEYEKNNELELNDSDYVVFTSASSVRGFVNTMEYLNYSSVNAICIGKITAKEASNYGMKISISKKATIESLVDCVIEESKRGIN